MNVEVENLPNCLAALHIELPADRVTKEWNEVVHGFQQVAKIPGFRPGKAPQSVIEAKFRKEIQEELTRKLVSETTREAIREKGLRVLSVSEVEDVEFTSNKSLKFTATLITSPEFELPNYKGITVRVPSSEVADEEVDAALQNLRERHATFSDVEGRGLETGDFAVIDYVTSIDGKPLLEVVEKAPKRLAESKDFWVKVDENSFLKGFGDQLIGLQKGDEKEFDIGLPDDYPLSDVARRTVHFQIAVKGTKRMELPEVDDAFANQVVEGYTVEQLKQSIRTQLEAEKSRRIEAAKQNQILDQLVSQVECELPQAYLKDETRRIMSEIVQQNQMRGVTEDALRENQKDIISAASRSAKDRLKANFILGRIAEKEGIEVSAQELKTKVENLAAQYRIPFGKMMADLDEKRAIPQVREEVLIGKVLDFLTSNANVHTGSE